MRLIDTHTHLDSLAQQGILPAALARARAAGLEALITIGTEPDDWSRIRDLAASAPGYIYHTVGLHPCSVGPDWAAAVAQLAGCWTAGPGPLPLGLGECGLDRFHLPADPAAAARSFADQRAAFAAQLEIGRQRACPIVIHSRGAFAECVEMIEASGVDWTKIVFHCFSEGPVEMAELNRRGGRGSFTGILTYKNADAVRAAARAQPRKLLMLETDAPFLAPVPHRGKPNEPALMRHTADAAAALLGMTPEEMGVLTSDNARAFFGLPPAGA
jgi:TatD DNase family protein